MVQNEEGEGGFAGVDLIQVDGLALIVNGTGTVPPTQGRSALIYHAYGYNEDYPYFYITVTDQASLVDYLVEVDLWGHTRITST
jgi:hypothetical protein